MKSTVFLGQAFDPRPNFQNSYTVKNSVVDKDYLLKKLYVFFNKIL